jgi:hypothetical protein
MNDSPRNPVLSLILCTRNDQYMGNSRWRLETTLNYTANKVYELGREEDVEMIISDWGSDIPLRDVLRLNPAATRIVSFVHVPPEIAIPLQKDSPFPEVLALNTAARRAKGQYIGRIDQDTLVGKRFLRTLLEMHDGALQPDVAVESALLFANRRSIPYRLAVRCPSLWVVDRFICWFHQFLRIEHPLQPEWPIYASDVGIWLLHRNLWHECGGYDERLIYMNEMEPDMVHRLLKKKYELVDLGKLVNYDFYHLDHYHPWRSRKSSTHRKVNLSTESAAPQVVHPNSENWGLNQYPLELLPYPSDQVGIEAEIFNPPRFKWLSFILLLLLTGVQIIGDKLIIRLGVERFNRWVSPVWWFLFASSTWKNRTQIARETVAGQPFISWPRLLTKLLIEKKFGQIGQPKG